MAHYWPPAKLTGLLKWGFQLPAIFYRAHLGWLFGHRFLLLTHQGRKSGRIYHTVLEVVHYDAAMHESAVLSAYGERADWYQNILAHPALEVRISASRYTPQQRLLEPKESLAALRVYQRKYRPAFRSVMRFLGYSYDGSAAGLRALADLVVVVAFRPQQTGSRADSSLGYRSQDD